MNKKRLVIVSLFIVLLFVATNISAIPAKFDWNNLPIQKETKRYENREYKTSKEYIDALQEGKCSSMWVWMHLDKEYKIDLIDNLKRMFKEKSNVTISKPTEYYVQAIDDMIANDPKTEQFKLGVVFKTIAIIEYDFDEGIDQDETAKKWLGNYYETVKEYGAEEVNE